MTFFCRYWYLLSQIPAGTGIATPVDQGPYPRPVAVLVFKSDMPGHLYLSDTVHKDAVYVATGHGLSKVAICGLSKLPPLTPAGTGTHNATPAIWNPALPYC